MLTGGRPTATAIAIGLTAQLTVAGVVVAHRVTPHHHEFDVLGVRDLPASAIPSEATIPTLSPTPLPTATDRELPLPTAVPLPSVPVSLPPVPVPSVSLPPVPVDVPQCNGTLLADPPSPADRFDVPPSGDDTNSLRVDDGAAYFTEITRDGNFTTTVQKIDLATGRQTHSIEDPLFAFTDVGAGYAWGFDRDGVVRLDPSSPSAPAKRWPRSDFTADTPDGPMDVSPVLVAAEGTTAYVFGLGPSKAATVSRVDGDSGDVTWTTVLPDMQDFTDGVSSGVRTVIGAYANSVYVALPVRRDNGDAVRVWRLTSAGKVVAENDVSDDGANANGQGMLSVGDSGVYVSVYRGTGQPDATVFRLDLDSLEATAHVRIPVLEDLNVVGDVLWGVSIQCNMFIWYRYDARSLDRVGLAWVMPTQSYSVDGTSNEIWSLRSREPMEPVALVGYNR